MQRGASGGGILHIVDADASVRSGLFRLAISAGFEVHTYASLEQFLGCMSAEAGGCVLLDSSLLDGGVELASTLRERGIDWPVIVLCAGDDAAAREDARNVGARFLLNKPVDAQALFDAIAWVSERGS